ncbi:DUF6366 family protein [Sediminibacillus terrae]|uniref:DUF6366 family protein n=1 Tax=Sediminibacillus terrae TaxID=1562106 RepID=UPI00129671FD|nr:DUF6366 family protein [Sediminibacillus terrae]
MDKHRETPEDRGARHRQEEMKNNATGNLHDAYHRSQSGSLVDLLEGLGWKGTGILIVVFILGLLLYAVWFH